MVKIYKQLLGNIMKKEGSYLVSQSSSANSSNLDEWKENLS